MMKVLRRSGRRGKWRVLVVGINIVTKTTMMTTLAMTMMMTKKKMTRFMVL
jgi:hypothetical protein